MKVLKIYDISEYLEGFAQPIPKEFVEKIKTEIMTGIKIGLLSAYPISYMQGLAHAIGVPEIILIGENGNYICSDANIPPQWHCIGCEDNYMECISQKSGIRLESIVIQKYQ